MTSEDIGVWSECLDVLTRYENDLGTTSKCSRTSDHPTLPALDTLFWDIFAVSGLRSVSLYKLLGFPQTSSPILHPFPMASSSAMASQNLPAPERGCIFSTVKKNWLTLLGLSVLGWKLVGDQTEEGFSRECRCYIGFGGCSRTIIPIFLLANMLLSWASYQHG